MPESDLTRPSPESMRVAQLRVEQGDDIFFEGGPIPDAERTRLRQLGTEYLKKLAERKKAQRRAKRKKARP